MAFSITPFRILFLFLFVSVIISTTVYGQAPINDLPCNATDLGVVRTQEVLELNSVSNVGATSENTFLNGSCLGEDPWQNTVYFRFTLDTPFIRGMRVDIIPEDNARLNVALMTPDVCGGVGQWFLGSDACASADSMALFTGLTCVENRQEFYIIVGSQSDLEEGTFSLRVAPIEPTYCDGCKNGNETVVDGPFSVSATTITPSLIGAANGSIQIDEVQGGDAPTTYSLDGGPFQSQPLFDNLAEGNYTLIVQDANGCNITFPFAIPSIDTVAPPTINSPIVVCQNTPIPIASANGLNVRWYADAGLNELLTTGQIYQPETVPDTLYVTQTINDIESEPVPFFVNLKEGVVPAEIQATPLIGYAPLTVNFSAVSDQNAASYLWNLGDSSFAITPTPVNRYTEQGEYTVVLEVTDQDGCTNTDSVTIRVIPPLDVHTGISPNADGFNDVWIIDNIDQAAGHTIKVYNQWGNLVFESTNYQSDWGGANLADGTYFYTIEFESGLPPLKGYLMILR